MRLHSISLSGFKSFADLTHVSLPTQVAGVVGPNGSGKSNIVDAIRWVLGERSARELRGGQLSDVIFNGSSTRQAASMARIELRFENAYGKLKGDYARFNEISVAREVDTEGQSSFFINNVRARRRDIVDCFLGTGLGPRSYAIIQQGTVSRLVEAKPEELRQHLEEVAGISLYKERRHETELRLKNTRENLSRLFDTIKELDKHLRQLKRQADSADKYRKLKQEHDTLHNTLVVARWRVLEKKIDALAEQAQKERSKSDALNVAIAGNEAELARINTSAEETQHQIEQQQQKYYELKQSIALDEQQISLIEKRHQDLIEDAALAEQQCIQLATQHTSDQAEMEDLTNQIAGLSTQKQQEQTKLEEKVHELKQVEHDYHKLQSAFEKSQQAEFELQKALELLRYQINHNEQQLKQVKEEITAVADPDPQLAQQLDELATAASSEQRNLDALNSTLQATEKIFASKRADIDKTLAKQKTLDGELKQLERQLRHDEGRVESLQTLIDNKTRHKSTAMPSTTLTKLKLQPILQQIKVAQGWEASIELAFGDVIRGYLAPRQTNLAKLCKELKNSGLSLGRAAASNCKAPPQGLHALDKIVTGPVPGWMQGIWFADTLETALAHWDKLQEHKIVCKDGSILSQDWLTLGHPPAGETLVSLQQRLNDTSAKVDKNSQHHNELEQQLQQLEAKRTTLSKELEGLEATLRSRQQDIYNARSRLERVQYQQKTAAQAEEHRGKALTELSAKSTALRQTIAGLQHQLTTELNKQEALQQSHGEIHDRHSFTSKQVQSLRVKMQQQKDVTQEIELALGKAQTRRDSITRNIEHTGSSVIQLEQRIARDKQQAEQLEQQPHSMREQLNHKVAAMGDYDKTLIELRQQLSADKHKTSQTELNLRAKRNQAEQLRDALQQIELQTTEASTRQQAMVEQLVGADFDTAAQETPQDVNITASQEQLERLEQSIRNLGEINHAAIKDYATESERRDTLETQHREIQQAIETLEAAINKIDIETKSLFQETFDKANEQLKRIFPDMFGGGNAWLELTSNDLLTSGVQIIARPPGKKNATIAMLSGGEKALTAISLVLALFAMNPAPFCVLDEVDAPLDDHNVVRFVTTIKKISAQVQFVLITHSKITMEYMDALLGVTMSEPGVSRMVSVDVDSALKMVG